MLKIKRVYEEEEAQDGVRFLVERLWPRGMKKEALRLDGWLKDLAPSSELRTWYQHDIDKWEEFQRRYRAELDAHLDAWKMILAALEQGNVTLLYSAHDSEHNSALVLMRYLEEQLQK